MDNFGSNLGNVFGWRLAAVWVALFGLGWLYAWLVYEYFPKQGFRRIAAQEVVGGTLGTIVGYGFALGWTAKVEVWQAVIVLLLCFAATGVPMLVGYVNINARSEADDVRNARLIQQGQLQDMLKGLKHD